MIDAEKIELTQMGQWLGSMPIGLIVVDSAGLIQYANPLALQLFGYSKSEMVGICVEALVPQRFGSHTHQREAYTKNPEQRAMGAGRHLYGRRKDGSEFPVEVGLAPVDYAAGKGTLCSVVDISERRRAEDEKDELLHQLDNRNDKILALYRVSELMRINDLQDLSLQHIAEAARAGLARTPVSGVRIVHDGKSVDDPGFQAAEWVIIRPIEVNGKVRGSLELHIAVPEDSTDDEFRGRKEQFLDAVAGVVSDAIERIEANAKVMHASKLAAVGELAAGVGHEINNPINGIINCAEILLKDAPADSKQAKYLELIRKESERVAGIVASLLAFSRQDRESHSLARICDVVTRVLDFCRKRIEKSHIVLQVDVPEDLPRILCRSEQLQQVMMNLLMNAVHALDERYPEPNPDKVLSVKAYVAPIEGKDWLQLIVEDHGCGIQPEHIGRVFDPFFSTKDKDKGTGLGLSVSDGIVKSHAGSILLESEVNRFTRFTISLPLPPPKEPVIHGAR